MADVQYVTLYIDGITPVQTVVGSPLYYMYLNLGADLVQTHTGIGVPVPGLDPTDPFPQYTTTAEAAAAAAAAAAGVTPSDASVAALITGNGSTATAVGAASVAAVLASPEVGAAYAPSTRLPPSALPIARIPAWAGSSTISGSGSTDNTRYGVAALTPQFVGLARLARYADSILAGVDGETSIQLLARYNAILDQNPGVVIINIGGNDASQNVPLTTYAANIVEMVERAKKRGIPVVMTTVTPRVQGNPGADRTALYNIWLTDWCQRQRIPLADFFGAIVDPATGYAKAGLIAGDGNHANNAGHIALAQTLAPVIRDLIPLPVWLPSHGVVPAGLVANPLVTGGSSSALPGTGWFVESGTATVFNSFTADPVNGDGLPAGKWAALTVDNTAGGASVTRGLRTGNIDSTKVSAGDRLRAYVYLKATGYIDETGLRISNGATVLASPISVLRTGAPGPVVIDFTAPASPTALRLLLTMTVAAGQTATGYMGACNIFNLTTGQLVGLP